MVFASFAYSHYVGPGCLPGPRRSAAATDSKPDRYGSFEDEWGVAKHRPHFEIIDRGYLDMTLDSSEAISLTLQPLPTGWDRWPGHKDCYVRGTNSNLSGAAPDGTYFFQLCGNNVHGIASFYQNVSTVAVFPIRSHITLAQLMSLICIMAFI